ncbi:MAG: sulfatase activating formylglycine-generating enzyme [Myxococcota bacterium]|jgi:formylglycine-generating enzyme required for sulfatase activity
MMGRFTVGILIVSLAGCTAETSVDNNSADKANVTNEMVMVPAGDFVMGCNPAADANCRADEMPHQRLFLDAFTLDKYEVTQADFAKCVAVGSCTAAKTDFDPELDWGGLAPAALTSPELAWPALGITWNQADAFCKWAGKRLPTEPEWEKAARGGCELYNDCESDSPMNPWGNALASCDNAVYMTPDELLGCGDGGALPVNSRPTGVSPYGAYNMIGNVSEWVDGLYEPYAETARASMNNEAIGMRVNKGACYGSFQSDLRIAARFTMLDAANYDLDYNLETDSAMGFRCAADVAK